MLQNGNYAGLLTSPPTVEEVLDDHAPELGHDLTYRNYVYRVVKLCLAIADNRVELEKITVAAVFHHLGISTNHVRLHRSVSRARAPAPRGSRDGGLDPRDRGDDRGSP
jgi:hypothetical protein